MEKGIIINNVNRKIKYYYIHVSGYIFLILFLISLRSINKHKSNKILKKSLIKINNNIFNDYKIMEYKLSYRKNYININDNNNNSGKNKKDSNLYKIIFYSKEIISFLIFLILLSKINIARFPLLYLFFSSNIFCCCIRTGIYGGSFNPIHNGHIALARQMLDAGLMDEVWFVVSPLNPFKKENNDLLSDELRLEMTQLALEDEPNMMAKDFEFHLPKPSYSWQTLKALTEQYPEREFILIIGADNWQAFHLWYNYQEILDNFSIVIYPREGIDVDKNHLPKNAKLLNTQLYPISSTQVRQYIKEGKSIDDLIPKKIITKAIKYYKEKQN